MFLLQYVTRMAYFDLVEITLCWALSVPPRILHLLLLLFIFIEIRYEKTEVLRIYVIRFMAWKWNKTKAKKKEVNIAGHIHKKWRQHKMLISWGQKIKYFQIFYAISSLLTCFRYPNVYSWKLLATLWYHKILRRCCQKV